VTRRSLEINVFDAAVARMESLYLEGDRVVVSWSGGKDSHICAEICVIAARNTGRLPVEIVMRDEEIMFPGTFEFAERQYQREDFDFKWFYANQPIVNVFSRDSPYWWVFDPQLDPDEWVRKPPPWATHITDLNIKHMIVPDRFPPPKGKRLVAVIGLRGQESNRRLMGIHNSKSFLTQNPIAGTYHARPIYDWTDGDVWLAHKLYNYDYNSAYDTMAKFGIPRHRLRIAPPSLSVNGSSKIQMAAKAWPQWFERVAHRLPGTRAVAQFGAKAISPQRRLGETWEECYVRLCIEESPQWISDRARKVKEVVERRHANHASTPIPETVPCRHCTGANVSWRKLTRIMYLGDPLSVATDYLGIPDVDPEVFRPGAGTWYPETRERKK
jgi:predicted phosphoadenosine phosphosulfate sulfurtransferase